MKAHIVVTSFVGDAEPYSHVSSASGPTAIKRAMDAAVAEQYERFLRGTTDVFGERLSDSLVMLWGYGDTFYKVVTVEAVAR